MGDVVQVSFAASTGNFSSAVDEVKDKIQSIAEPVTNITGSLKELGEVLAGVFVVDQIKDFAEEVAETAVQIKSLSQVSGLSTGTIQTLQFAMEMSGGSAEAAGVMIQRFERSIFEASAGSGIAYQDFQRLGVSLHELRTASPTELFTKTLDGFKGISDASERADIQMRLFSRSAQRLGPVLVQGSAGFTKMGEMLDETSAKMNDARVNEMAGFYSDALRMKDAWEGLGETLLISVAPALEMLMKFLKEVAEDLNHVIMYTQLAVQGFLLFTHLQSLAQTQANVKLIENLPDEDTAAGGAKDRNTEAQAEEQKKIAMQMLEDKAKLYSEDFANFKANEDMKVALGQETKSQEMAAEIRAMEAMRDLQLTNLQNEIDLNKDNALEHQKQIDEKLIMEEKFNTQLTELRAKQATDAAAEAKKEQKPYEEMLRSMDQQMDAFIRNTLTGKDTIAQAFHQMAQTMVLDFISAIAQMMARWAIFQLATSQGWKNIAGAAATGGDNNSMIGKLATGILSLIGVTTVSQSGTELNTSALALNTSALATNTAALGASAASGGGGAAGSLLGGVMDVGSLVAFAEGTTSVPRTMPALIHAGEMIIPSKQAQGLREGSLAMGAGGGDSHVHFHVNAMDGSDVASFFNRHGKTLAKTIQNQMRGPLRTMMARS